MASRVCKSNSGVKISLSIKIHKSLFVYFKVRQKNTGMLWLQVTSDNLAETAVKQAGIYNDRFISR